MAKAKAKVSPEEVFQKAREAFYNYEFEEAADLYDEYRTLQTKAKQPLAEELDELERQLEIASNAFDRVQKIVIVDSLSLPRSSFYNSYILSPSSGRIGLPNDLNVSGIELDNELSFLNESGDFLIGVTTNEDGEMRLIESRLLLDGNRENVESLRGSFEKSGDYNYPFMSTDGQTLYFANNGEESMGGYDLFVAQKDPINGEYLQPLNLGMPFNSPFDDIMLAIDEENGIGWWATDRGRDDGNLTVYVYLIDDIRRNYPNSTENLAEYAKIIDYKATWTDSNMEPILPVMPSVTKTLHAGEEKDADFEFNLGNGKTYKYFSDFRNKKAAEMMKQYQKKAGELEKRESKLAELRMSYKKNKSLSGKILEEEENIEDLRSQVKSMKNEILRLEKSMR